MTLNHARALSKNLSSCTGLLLIASSLVAGCGGGASSPTCAVGTHLQANSCVADPPSNISQALADDDTVWALLNGVVEMYNQNLAGKPSGAQNITGPCPVGGTVQITGTTSVDSAHNLTSVSLRYAMTNCKISEVSTSPAVTVALTLNGTLTETGSWNMPTFKSANYQTTGLAINGTDRRTGYAEATIAETCDVAFSHNISSSGNTYSGTVCGRPASN